MSETTSRTPWVFTFGVEGFLVHRIGDLTGECFGPFDERSEAVEMKEQLQSADFEQLEAEEL